MFKVLLATLLFASVPALVSAETNGTLTTIAQFAAPSSYSRHALRPFRLTGTCLCTMGNGLILEDPTGRASIFTSRGGPNCRAGSRVQVSGQSGMGWMTDLFDDIHQAGAEVLTLKEGTPPPFVRTAIPSLVREKKDFQLVRFSGSVVDAFRDDVDDRYYFLLVKDGDSSLTVGYQTDRTAGPDLAALVDSTVEVCGVFMQNYTGARLYLGPYVYVPTEGSIKILEAAPADPFSAPSIDTLRTVSPQVISTHGRVTAVGTVLAIQRNGRILLGAGKNRIINVNPTLGTEMPSCGSCIKVIGYPKTDMFHLNLVRARW